MAVDLTARDAAQDKVQESLAAVFDQYAPLLYRYALRLCRDQIMADQIVGDVFSQLLERLAAGEGPQTNLRAYLYQITYHFVVDHARDRERNAPLDELSDMQAREKDVITQVEDQGLLDAVAAVVNQELTDEQRQVIVLRFQENFSLRDTAEIMNKDVNAIKALQNRAITKLQNALMERNYEP